MKEETYYRDIKFIDDHPSSSDEFRGKPHQNVADTLVSILKSEDGGRAIGLEGIWGSGKSTVIDIAQSTLQKDGIDSNDEHHHTFFVFDAWAHQSDPLRRAFLQELIQCLESNDAVDKDYWNEQLEKLETSRKKVTETRAAKLSWVAKVTLLTIPIYPIAYFMLKDAKLKFTFNIPQIGTVNMVLTS